jgi:hypothetical protein
LDFDLLILDEVNILQQYREPLLIFLHCHNSKLKFKELFHLSFIVILGQIFLFEISFELPPCDRLLIKVLGFLKLIPPHGCLSLQVVGGNSSFYPGGVIMQLKIFLHFQQLGFSLFSLPMFTIENRWLDFLEFTLQDIFLRSSPLPPNRRHPCP